MEIIQETHDHGTPSLTLSSTVTEHKERQI
jgi:hypothetical protein